MSKKKHVRSSDNVSNCFGAVLGLCGGWDFRCSPSTTHIVHTFCFLLRAFSTSYPYLKAHHLPPYHTPTKCHSLAFRFSPRLSLILWYVVLLWNWPTSTYALDKPRLPTSAISFISLSKTSLLTPQSSWRWCGPIGPITPGENLGWPLHWGTMIPQRSTPRRMSKCRLFRREGTDNFGWGDQFPMFIGQYHFPPFSTFDNGIPAVFPALMYTEISPFLSFVVFNYHSRRHFFISLARLIKLHLSGLEHE